MDNIILYHGTDERIIKMTKEERKRYLDDCNLVTDALFPICKPLLQWETAEIVVGGKKVTGYEYALKKYEKLLNEKGGKYTYGNFLQNLTRIDARNNGSGWYQYNDLYLCASKLTAFRYAQSSFAGGETGLNAYRLIEGFNIIFSNIDLDSRVKGAMDAISEFGKEGNERPVFVTVDNIDISYLSFEDGKPIEEDDIKKRILRGRNNDYKFRYTKPIELSQCIVEPLSKELYIKIKGEVI